MKTKIIDRIKIVIKSINIPQEYLIPVKLLNNFYNPFGHYLMTTSKINILFHEKSFRTLYFVSLSSGGYHYYPL
jgi:hypothetical protein